MPHERLFKILSLQLDWIRNADAKVSPIFAIDVAMLGVSAALAKTITSWTIWAAVAGAISSLLLLSSILMLAFVSFPRIEGPKGSNIFFGGIAQQDLTKFADNLANSTDEDSQRDFANQIHRNAEIASSKYSFLKLAFILMFLGMPVWLVSVFFLYQ
ncbi:MAG: Pycsar system effector family protein [Pseudomonadota bacterium]